VTRAIHGQTVRAAVADPIPELQLDPMELPAEERAVALERLAAKQATRRPDRPVLTAEQQQTVHTAYLAGWNACRLHYAEVTHGEILALLNDAAAVAIGVRFEVAGGQGEDPINEPAPAGGRRA